MSGSGSWLTGLILSLSLSVSAHAGEPVRGVVELFTSQGCSSCPPADKLMNGLAERDDIVSLSYHVDYWDYLGWKDSLGSPDNTQRQYAYREALGSRSVYTPQAIVNGSEHFVGSDQSKLSTSVSATSVLPVAVGIDRIDGSIRIRVGAGNAGTSKAKVLLVRFVPEHSQDIPRGENRGRTIRYSNSVQSVQAIGMWKGAADEFVLPADSVFGGKAGGCAVIVQEVTPTGNPSRIIGAAKFEL